MFHDIGVLTMCMNEDGCLYDYHFHPALDHYYYCRSLSFYYSLFGFLMIRMIRIIIMQCASS